MLDKNKAKLERKNRNTWCGYYSRKTKDITKYDRNRRKQEDRKNYD